MSRPPEGGAPRSIRRWLLWVLSISLGTVMLVNGWVQFVTADRPIDAAFDHSLHDDAYAVSGYIRVGDGQIGFDLPAGADAILRTDPDDALYFLVLGPHGEYIAGDRDLPVPQDLEASVEQVFDMHYRGEPVRGILHLHPSKVGDVSVYVAQTLRARKRLGGEVAAGLLVSNGLLMAITLLIVYAVVGTGLRPLLRLQAEIEARQPGALDPISERGLPEEVLPLGRALNRLLRMLLDSIQAQRKFLTDAAHQLRTPLAGLQGQLDLLAHESLPQPQKERVLSLHEATRRLAHLSDRLLALGRSEARANPVTEMVAVDLADVVDESASLFLDRALAKGIDIGFEAEPAPIVGSGWMVRELAHNLIDNAILYTPEGGRITVRSRIDGSFALLEVEDNGPGIPEHERERVFERFVRGSGAGAMGCGLGLAIVKEISDIHRATVTVQTPADGTGCVFRVSFPAVHERG